ncbi:MAG: photosynthetic complex putative assembly protein PuhB [Pseudomonadota bacterium]
MSGVGEHDGETVDGLPGALPAGERLLWQGAPDWRAVAVHTLHLRKLAIYFAALLALRLWVSLDAGTPFAAAMAGVAGLAAVALVGLGFVVLFAWLTARGSRYTLTDRRLVLNIGIALPMSINLPFARIDGADLKRFRDGSGEIALTLDRSVRASYVVMWPHVRTLKLVSVTPVLRGLPEPDRVAGLLGDALTRAAGANAARTGSAGDDLTLAAAGR